jgi:hypothetical protein
LSIKAELRFSASSSIKTASSFVGVNSKLET